MTYSKSQLVALETIEQAWDGDELKIYEGNTKVWLTLPENRAYNGDYTVETYNSQTGKWEQENLIFE